MGKIRKILGRAVSMKTAVILLIILVAVCIAASIVPQGRTFEQYASAYSERSAAVIIALGLDDAYHSWWSTLLSVLLCLDLAACNLVRMPATARRAAKETEPAAASSMKPDAEASGIRDPQGFLRALGMPRGKEAEDSEGKRILFSSKNRIGIWGAWICHAGIFILILGFGLGQIFTESYAVYGVAGQEKEFGSGYTLKIDDFRVLLREDDTVEQYISDITVNSPSGGSASAEISVNHPGKMFGMKFYQNSTGWAAGIRVMKGDELIQSDTVCAGEYLEIRDVPGLVVFLNAVYPDYAMQDGRPVTLSGRPVNPGYLYSIYYMQNMIGMNVLLEGEAITIDDLTVIITDPESYTVIQIKRDPFTAIAFIGGIVTMLGLFINFYMPVKSVWAYEEEDGWHFFGRSPKGGMIFSDSFASKAEEIKEERVGQ
ncbi:MAG: cytochrome c biogenesis protein ResB [Eubacteriaceae bacterium]|nr:cytochrome c biogenesis protein ResB [Eubacteriaceae bacterium]